MAGTDNDHVEIVHDGFHSDSRAMFHVKHGGWSEEGEGMPPAGRG
jgi:hypothetical protein